MSGDGGQQEWITVSHSPGRTLVRVTRREGPHSVKWAVKAYPGMIKNAVSEARTQAIAALIELQEALSDE